MGSSAATVPQVPVVIAGADISNAATFDVVNPRSGELVWRCVSATADDAAAAVDSASKAFESWRETTPGLRRDIFLKAVAVLDRRADELKSYMQGETGADEAWAAINITLARECILSCASRVDTIEGRAPALQEANIRALIVKEPYGVVLAIAPWNAPYALGFRAVMGPITAGNTVILKGSELSPRCFWAVQSVLAEAGLPQGVCNFVACGPADAAVVTNTMIAAPAVKKINFTGSTAVGRLIARVAGDHLKPVLLELGGKAPAIVCEDADLDLAAQQCVLGAFLNAGQICMSTERIVVHKSIRADFEKKLVAALDTIFPPTRAAPVLVAERGVIKNKQLVRDAMAAGATLVYGDIDAVEESKCSLRPLVISQVTPKMEIYSAESFGPSVSVVEYDVIEDAVRIANDSDYGLSSAVFSTDLRKALKIAMKIETGAVHINRMTVQDEAALPHGGAKGSGFGRFNAHLDEWLRTKNITYDL